MTTFLLPSPFLSVSFKIPPLFNSISIPDTRQTWKFLEQTWIPGFFPDSSRFTCYDSSYLPSHRCINSVHPFICWDRLVLSPLFETFLSLSLSTSFQIIEFKPRFEKITFSNLPSKHIPLIWCKSTTFPSLAGLLALLIARHRRH